jgi:hypothetical protein
MVEDEDEFGFLHEIHDIVHADEIGFDLRTQESDGGVNEPGVIFEFEQKRMFIVSIAVIASNLPESK